MNNFGGLIQILVFVLVVAGPTIGAIARKLKAHAEEKVSDDQMERAAFRFPFHPPATKEAYFYRSLFEEHFPGDAAAANVPAGPSIACSSPTAIAWDESFKTQADPSGRAVRGVHRDSY